jgi:predicted HicB family RNase H-like nuclease
VNVSEETKVSKAQQKAVAKYMKNNYDEIKIRVEKGKRDIIKVAAETAGESLNSYIKKAVDQRMERDNA